MAGILSIEQFDLERTLRCGQGHRWQKDKKHPGWYSSVLKVVDAPDVDRLVWIRQVGGTNGRVEYWPDEELVREALCDQFQLDEDIGKIYQSLSADHTMSELVDCYRGLRVMRVDPWECLVFFILARGISIQVTHGYMQKIEEWGDTVGNCRRTFPPAAKVREKMADQGLGFKHRFGEKVVPLLERAASVTIDLNPQDTLDYKAVVDCLRKDVGDKAADCVSLFALGEKNAFPKTRPTRRLL